MTRLFLLYILLVIIWSVFKNMRQKDKKEKQLPGVEGPEQEREEEFELENYELELQEELDISSQEPEEEDGFEDIYQSKNTSSPEKPREPERLRVKTKQKETQGVKNEPASLRLGKEDLKQGIILSQLLGSPRAHKPYRPLYYKRLRRKY